MSDAKEHLPDWTAISSQVHRRLGRRLQAPRDWLEDAVQDALVCMLALARGGKQVQDFVGFGIAFVKKRWAEELRRRRRRGEVLDGNLDARPAGGEVAGDAVDWQELLRQMGWAPTEAWSRILLAIANGVRGKNRIAEVLGLDQKSVLESRRRLQRWLREKLD